MTPYEQGFTDKCAEFGVDGDLLLKEAARGDQLFSGLRRLIQGGQANMALPDSVTLGDTVKKLYKKISQARRGVLGSRPMQSTLAKDDVVDIFAKSLGANAKTVRGGLKKLPSNPVMDSLNQGTGGQIEMLRNMAHDSPGGKELIDALMGGTKL